MAPPDQQKSPPGGLQAGSEIKNNSRNLPGQFGESNADARHLRQKATPRNIKSAEASGGWAWVEKAALDRILLKTANAQPGNVIAVYMALGRLSSDRGNAGEVTAGKALLSKLAGVSPATVKRALADLESLSLLQVTHRKSGRIHTENSYMLLSVYQSKLPEKGRVTVDLGSRNGQFCDPTLKESKKKGGASAPALSAAGAPKAVADSPSGNPPKPQQPKRAKSDWLADL